MASEVDINDLFDPAKAPTLTGLSVDDIEASPEQLAAAELKLAQRSAAYPWSILAEGSLPGSLQPFADRATYFRERSGALTKELARLATEPPGKARPAVRRDLHSALEQMTLAEGLAATIARTMAGQGLCCLRPLPFYGEEAWLLHIAPSPLEPVRRFILVDVGEEDAEAATPAEERRTLVELDGDVRPIQEMNQLLHKRKRLLITKETMEEYVDFFCTHVHAALGPFGIIEHEAPPEGVAGQVVPAGYDLRPGPIRAQAARPLIWIGSGEDERGTFEQLLASVFFGRHLFRTLFRARPDGVVEMVQDQVVEGAAVDPVPLAWQGPGRLANGSNYERPPEHKQANDPS